jgi:hypothetical protein
LSEKDKVRGKKLCYSDEVSGEHSYSDVYYLDNGGRQYFITTTYTDSQKLDSVVEYNNKALSSYSYLNKGKTLSKNEIFLDTIINDGTRLGLQKINFKSLGDSAEFMVSSESRFVKDTLFNFRGDQLPTLVIQTTWNTTMKDRFADGTVKFQMTFLMYFAKGIGKVRTRIYNINEKRIKNIDLVAIQDLLR